MIALIAAFTKKGRVIGKGGKIPWDILAERAYFRLLTTGNAVVMGRKTFEEIGKPLPNRLNIVVSATKNFCAENCITVRSLSEALAAAHAKGFTDIFIAGGRKLYEEALPLAGVLYLTEIHAEYSGDVFFPPFDAAQYSIEPEEATAAFTRYAYRRIGNS
ncbi:MAG: dihydrofolate reductase [Treponema sp.]